VLKVVAAVRGADTVLPPHLYFLAIQVELLATLWLWSGFRPATARLACMGLFCVFATFNLTRTAQGATSCACFGVVRLAPWLAVGLDLLVIASLWAWRPRLAGASYVSPLQLGLAFLGLSALLWSLALSEPGLRKPTLTTSPSEERLGTIKAGTQNRVRFLVRNQSERPQAVARISVSCPCVRATLARWVLQPGEETSGEAVLDLHIKPEFTGKLEMPIIGYSPTGARAFSLLVRANVVR
jgi:hypothetical protein